MATQIKNLILACLLCGPFYALAQKIATQPLKIGDQIPDLELETYDGKKIGIKTLYEKAPLIIDFWATWCVPCINEIRLTDSLAQKHPGRFNVLLISNQKQEIIRSFLSRPINQDLRGLGNRVIAQDTLLNKLFPHRTIPHNVWIDEKGIIRAITSGVEINENNLLNFQRSKGSLNFRTKTDKLDFHSSAPFHLGDSSFTYRSIVSPFIEGIPSGQVISQRGKRDRYFQHNQTLLRALWGAYSGFVAGIRDEMIELHTQDSSRYFSPKMQDPLYLKKFGYADRIEWQRRNLFCYDLILPQPVPDSVFASYIFNDMERQFSVKSEIVVKKINCIVVSSKELSLKASPAKESKTEIRFTPDQQLIVKYATIPELLDFLFRAIPADRLPYPLLNKTHYPENFRFDLEEDFASAPGIEKTGITTEIIFDHLKKYGLNFAIKKTDYPILLIKDPRP